MVVNSKAREAWESSGRLSNIRITAGTFATEVSQDHRVLELVEMLYVTQGEVLINVFESREELTLAGDERTTLIGPEPALAASFNSKIKQYGLVKELGIPVPQGDTFSAISELLMAAEEYFKAGHKVFVTEEYSAAGSNSIIASNTDEIVRRFGLEDRPMLLTQFIEHPHDPTVLGIVAGEDDVYIASVADQNIDGTRFMGSTFPSELNGNTIAEIREMTRTVGSHLGKLGYRGAFGCDFIIDEHQKSHFIEINARNQGTTMESALTIACHHPDQPAFPVLELMAVLDGKIPEGVVEMESADCSLKWGTFNYKVNTGVNVINSIDQVIDEAELFRNVYEGKEGGHIIVDHVGAGVSVEAGGFLARIIAVSDSGEKVRSFLDEAIREVAGSFGP